MRDILDPQDRWLGTPGGFLSSSNKAPIAIDDTFSVAQDSGAVSLDVLVNDFDPEGQALTLISASATLGIVVAEANNTVTYTPPAGLSGFDTVVYEVADDLDQRRTAQVNITITGPVLAINTLTNNTLVIEADPAALDLTITQPEVFTGTYSMSAADLTAGPLNLVPPTVAGTFSASEVLAASRGLWIYDTDEGGPVQSWQWRLDDVDISGATEATYTVQPGDIGHALTVLEVQSDNAGQRFASAAPAGAQTFQPDLDAGLLGWWDATDAASITEAAGVVSNWADKSGGSALVQTNTAARPLTGTRTLNGLNILDFNGNQSIHDAARSLPVSGDVAFHMVLVIDSTANAYEAVLSVDATNDFQLDSAHVSRFDGQLNLSGVGTTVPLTGGAFSGGLIVSIIFDRTGTATAEVFIADVSRGLTGYTVPLDPNVALNVMANRGLNARVDGAVGEIVLTSTLNNRTDYNAYLAAKWGLI